MTIKDIVNRDLVNLQNCESEPIHIPGSIQPHGFLIALKQDSFTIDFCTGNTHDFIRLPHTALLGKSFGYIFGETELNKLKAYLSGPADDVSKPFVLVYKDVEYNTLIHVSGAHFVLDAEPFPDGSLTLPDLYSQTKRFVSSLQQSVTLQDLCRIIADETRFITGYDRVMIYRFDKDYNGEVFAESKREDLEGFFGLHYPHTDIPVQARALYMRNLMRIIVDVGYTPVPIYTIDDVSGKNLDLSDSVLRSVSPIHVEYLQNIGVGATLTISLMHNKRLWGLIACHHYSPKNLPHYTRLAAQLQGHFLTSQINVREVAEEFDNAQAIEKSLEKLLATITKLSSGDFAAILNQHLLKITNATGVVFLNEGSIYSFGLTPATAQIEALIQWLSLHYPEGHYTSSNLAADYPEAKNSVDTSAGILYHALGIPNKDCIIWFRHEVKKTVNWAGDPNKAIIKNEKGLSPRKSFELWKEITQCQSEDWTETELNASAKFAYVLQKQTHMLYLIKEEIKYRLLSEKLQKANSELENINWISNHDLKEPVRKIQVFASKILEEEKESLSEFAASSIKRMSDSAFRMQQLINDLMEYSHLRDTKDVFVKVELNVLLENVKQELQEELNEKQAVVEVAALPSVSGIPFQVHQLFLNLIQNSLKFTKNNVVPVIRIECEQGQPVGEIAGLDPAKEYYKIIFHDNGIGFSNDYSQVIFQVFKRLHSVQKYKGTGIGLAICKKIMEIHGGTITASGEINQGAQFVLYFPVQI